MWRDYREAEPHGLSHLQTPNVKYSGRALKSKKATVIIQVICSWLFAESRTNQLGRGEAGVPGASTFTSLGKQRTTLVESCQAEEIAHILGMWPQELSLVDFGNSSSCEKLSTGV